MAEINPIQQPKPLPRVEKMKRDRDQPGRDQSRREEREQRDEQPLNQHIDDYA
jgi:hypothetical protein